MKTTIVPTTSCPPKQLCAGAYAADCTKYGIYPVTDEALELSEQADRARPHTAGGHDAIWIGRSMSTSDERRPPSLRQCGAGRRRHAARSCGGSASTSGRSGRSATSTSSPGRAGHRARAATTAPASRHDQDDLRHLGARWRRDPLGRQAGHICTAAGRRGARDHDHLPGPRAVRQPRHRPEHVPRPRAAPASSSSTRTAMERRREQTLTELRGDHGALDPPAGRLAVRRPAAVGRGRQGRDVEGASS